MKIAAVFLRQWIRPQQHQLALLGLMVLALAFAGCKPAKKEQASSGSNAPSSKSTAASATPTAPLSLDDGNDPIALTPADRAWRDLQLSFQPPQYPPEWETNEPSEAQIAEFEKKSTAAVGAAADRGKEFYTKYPDHDKAAAARQQEQQLLAMAAQMGDTNRLQQVMAMETARLKDPNIPEEERLELRMQQLHRELMATNDPKLPDAVSKLEAVAFTLQKEFPKRPEPYSLMAMVAEGWLGQNEPEKARQLAQQAAQSAPDGEAKDAARDLLSRLDRVGKPLPIKFKALDGREVDLEKMKGKVVLIDWWATWCQPCIIELPKVKAAYEKLHARGFEIVGISLDQDKSRLEKAIEREKMTWPQYFEEEGKDNVLAEKYGISSIPTMWLLDKKGNLRDLNARGQLAEKVEKLLAEE